MRISFWLIMVHYEHNSVVLSIAKIWEENIGKDIYILLRFRGFSQTTDKFRVVP
jgi:hypothetical protein